jgi:hypothetical protein
MGAVTLIFMPGWYLPVLCESPLARTSTVEERCARVEPIIEQRWAASMVQAREVIVWVSRVKQRGQRALE